ncbi:MAG: protein TolR, partial [bacterium]|nr:protein TolR [bacterium]
MQIQGQQAKGRRLSANLSEINVTPLVDVMLVLLIIFMITAPMMQSGITVNLPSAETRSNPSSGGLILTVTKDHYVYMENQVV